MSFENFFERKLFVALFTSFEKCMIKETLRRKPLKRTITITWVSNYKEFKLDTLIGQPRDHAPITRDIGAERAMTMENFVTDTNTH